MYIYVSVAVCVVLGIGRSVIGTNLLAEDKLPISLAYQIIFDNNK